VCGILEEDAAFHEPEKEPPDGVKVTALSPSRECGAFGAVLFRDFGQVAGEAKEMELANREDVSDCLAMEVFEEAREHEPRSLGDRARDAARMELFEISREECAEPKAFSAPAGGHDG
jgi:hypothetical protein